MFTMETKDQVWTYDCKHRLPCILAHHVHGINELYDSIQLNTITTESLMLLKPEKGGFLQLADWDIFKTGKNEITTVARCDTWSQQGPEALSDPENACIPPR